MGFESYSVDAPTDPSLYSGNTADCVGKPLIDRRVRRMTEDSAAVTDESYDSYDETNDRPMERWAPLGAANASPPLSCSESGHNLESERLKNLEEEQEQLNSSLFALTTHFAQVQFRLKQIVDAPTEHKEALLKELEEFAFKGIPDVRGCTGLNDSSTNDLSDKEHDEKIAEQRQKQIELIQQLKSQLEDLEIYAYETGEADMPTSRVMEKQKVVIDQLKNKLDLNDFEHFDKLSAEELRQAVDKAIGQIVNPAKVKEKLVDQLKTQIVDLERFIEFLQGEGQTPGPSGGERCVCPLHGTNEGAKKKPENQSKRTKSKGTIEHPQNFREQTLSMMRHALTLLQIFAITQLGCGGKDFQKNLLKRTTKGNHWGDLRARLEMAISRVAELGEKLELEREKTECLHCPSEDGEDVPVIQYDLELVTAVRKDLAVALRDLLQHGLFEVGQSQSLVPFGCLPNRNVSKSPQMMHAWDLFLKYYETKHGKEYSEEPARRLSMAFGLEVVGGKAVTARQTLLSAIEEVASTHQPLKRSEDSQFKAFVCVALNQRKLVTWLRILVRSTWLVEYYYQPWSYVVKTGFDDSLVSLERLMKLNFNLPTDLAIRPFQNIKDAF